jgi:hypothetical protein
MTRDDRAIAVARQIEAFDHCPILSAASIKAIDRALAQYAFDRFMVLRDLVSNQTLDARGKADVLGAIDALMREDVE